MPNWKSSTLYVRGKQDEVDIVQDFLEGKNLYGESSVIDFNQICPLRVPTESTQEQEWGTKWNVGSAKIVDNGSENELCIQMETANTYPTPIAMKLCAMFPGLEVELVCE